MSERVKEGVSLAQAAGKIASFLLAPLLMCDTTLPCGGIDPSAAFFIGVKAKRVGWNIHRQGLQAEIPALVRDPAFREKYRAHLGRGVKIEGKHAKRDFAEESITYEEVFSK